MEISEERRAFYLRALVDLTEERIRYAFEAALVRCPFFPKIAELFEYAYEYKPAAPLPDFIQDNLGKNPITEVTAKFQRGGGITEADMAEWRERGRVKHERILVDIANSDMIRDLGGGDPVIERKINAVRVATGHRLAIPEGEFEPRSHKARRMVAKGAE